MCKVDDIINEVFRLSMFKRLEIPSDEEVLAHVGREFNYFMHLTIYFERAILKIAYDDIKILLEY